MKKPLLLFCKRGFVLSILSSRFSKISILKNHYENLEVLTIDLNKQIILPLYQQFLRHLLSSKYLPL